MKKRLKIYCIVLIILTLFFSKAFAGVTYLGSGEAFDTTSDNSTPAGIAFNNDGTKVFVMGTASNEDEVNEYSLGTAWDISTTNAITRRLGVGTAELGTPIQDSAPFGLTFNGDGTKLYISGNSNNKIFELDLGSAFNISSAVKVGELETDSHANGDTTPCGITFNNDGTKLFLAGFANHRIVYWTLTTAYDIETAGDPGKYDVSSTSHKPRDVDFNSDGTKMYVVSFTDHISEYTLDTAFDLSSGVTHKGDLDVGSQDNQPFTMEFNSDGTKFFMQGYGNDDIHEYTLTTAFEINNTAPTLSSSSPSDGASSVGVNDNIVLTFSEAVDAESGNIIIKKSSDDSTVETISVTSSNVSGSGSTQITINPDTTLDVETGYYITIASTAFDDVDSASYAGISDSTTLNFTTKIDPLTDKDVVGLIEAQTEAPKRILQHVTTPVLNRMDWLRRHRKEDNLTNQNIKFQFSNEMLSSLSKVISASFDVNEASKLSDNWSFWSEGSISVGKIGDTSSSSSKDINSNGITIGVDKKIDENRMYGYALRFGRDDVDVGTSGTSLDTEAYSLSLYGTFPHDDTKFIDSVIGISSLKTDHVRKSGANTLTGDRSGRQVFGSINFRTTYNKEKFNKYTDTLLYLAARNEHIENKIKPALSKKKIVICDRFTQSTVAYQGYGRGLPGYVIDQDNELAIGGLKPDLVILLDMPPEDALRRVSAQTTMLLEEPIDAGEKRRDNDGQRRFEQEPLRFHHDVRRGYLAQAQAEPQRWLVIDGTLQQADIEEIIWGKVESLLKD